MIQKFCVSIVVAVAFSASLAWAAVKTYQVTGPVVKITNQSVIVQKGKEKWEIAKDTGSKVPPDLKVGDKVTIDYRMIATDVDVKTGKAAKKQ